MNCREDYGNMQNIVKLYNKYIYIYTIYKYVLYIYILYVSSFIHLHLGCACKYFIPHGKICHEAGYVAPSSSCTDQGVFETAEAAQAASVVQVANGTFQ